MVGESITSDEADALLDMADDECKGELKYEQFKMLVKAINPKTDGKNDEEKADNGETKRWFSGLW